MRPFRSYVLCIVFGLGCCADAAARNDEWPRDLRLDHTLALSDSGSSRLDFQLKIPYERLVFRREDAGFAASLRLACHARRSGDGREMDTLIRDRVLSEDFAASRRRNQHYFREFDLPLGPGDWKVTVKIFSRGADHSWERRFDVKVPDSEAGELFLQGPHWPGAGYWENTPPFTFFDPWRLPLETSRFVDGAAATVPVSCALLNWHEETLEAEVVLTLERAGGALAHYARQHLSLGPGRRDLSWEIPVERLDMGAYLLQVELRVDERHQRNQGRLDVGLTRAAFGRSWNRTLRLLRPLASAEEWIELSETPRELRLQAWQQFWARRDSSGELPGNAALEIYCERISEANARFGGAHASGYLSDRGQVYLEHGPPNRTERYEDDRYFRILEYWHYDALGLVYIFEDRHGGDEFTLLKVGS